MLLRSPEARPGHVCVAAWGPPSRPTEPRLGRLRFQTFRYTLPVPGGVQHQALFFFINQLLLTLARGTPRLGVLWGSAEGSEGGQWTQLWIQ